MNNNVVIAVFEVESEAYQAFTQLKGAVAGKGYTAPEAALIKNTGGSIELVDGYSSEAADSGTTMGMVIGSLVGVLLGAATGALAGSASDSGRAVDTASVVAVVASKIYEGEIAVAALVSEDEPAFDAVFDGYKTTIMRYDAADIADDVNRFQEFATELSNQVLQEAKADRKAERAEQREEQRAKIKGKFEEYEAATNRSMGY